MELSQKNIIIPPCTTGSKRRVSIGSWITIPHPSIAEIMAKSGFGWLVVDMEHSAITISQAQQLIQVIELSGVVPIVRVGENNPYLIKRVMDAGAHGVIVPMVNTREDAIKAVNAVKYPPVGKRGVGLTRAQGYGFEFEEYKEWINKESIAIIQIEDIKGVKNLKDILQTDGIDCSMVGPYDLSGSLGYPGDFDRPEFKEALNEYEEISKEMNKPTGFHIVQPDYKMVNYFREKGYTFLAVGVDMLYIGTKCREVIKNIVTA